MKRRAFLLTPLALASPSAAKPLLDREAFRHYVDQFNRDDKEDVAGLIHNGDGKFQLKLPGKPYLAVQLRTVV
jgi:hypothetical protein